MSKYVDMSAIANVIGNVFNNPSLLDERDRYYLTEEDFSTEFHKIVFGSIYNIHLTNSAVNLNSIVDYLSGRPRYKKVFEDNQGIEYLQRASTEAQLDTFNFYYQRVKKFTLLRGYESIGFDVRQIYDVDEVLNSEKKTQQENWLDSHSSAEIASTIDKLIDSIKDRCLIEDEIEAHQAGENALELIEKLKVTPEVGIPLYGDLINTVTRGARLKKLYIRSAGTGMGKTRMMIADACNFACNKIYDKQFGWIKNGQKEPTLFIATEQDLTEVQTMMLAFLADVNEEHILNGRYLEGEEDRVIEAARILIDSPLWIETCPDFSIQDIEDKIKKHIREHDVTYVVYDYLHSSMKILEEITRRSGGIKLREDNILFILSTKLKDICNQYGVFILTGTQLSGDYRTAEIPDQSFLRGARSIADRCDVGMIALSPTTDDLAKVEEIVEKMGCYTPNMKISVYKNRRGRYKGIYIWCYADLGTCRVKPLFITDYHHSIQTIERTTIIVK